MEYTYVDVFLYKVKIVNIGVSYAQDEHISQRPVYLHTEEDISVHIRF